MEDLRGLSLPSKETGDGRQKTRANLSAQSVSFGPYSPRTIANPAATRSVTTARLRSTLCRRHADELARELKLPVTDLRGS